MTNTYIQDKLNGLRERYKNSESLNPFIDDIEYYFKESITDYHNHIIEKIEEYANSQTDEAVAMGIIGTVSLLKD
jgi:uncharacterized protein YbgA (DUF1722 family)